MTEQTQRCCKEVWSGRAWRPHHCKNKAKVERDGKFYCLMHDPVRKEEKYQARRKAENRKYQREHEGNHAKNVFQKLIKDIDWELLKKQKEYLIRELDHLSEENKNNSSNMALLVRNANRIENLEGMLAFVDSVQDAAAEVIGEDKVFGPKCPACDTYMKVVVVEIDGANLEEQWECPECGY